MNNADWPYILAKVGRTTVVSAAGALAREAARALLPEVPAKKTKKPKKGEKCNSS